jgi:hypothetical protein
MPIFPADLVFRLSGGATNTLGDSALGGEISSTEVSGSLNALFDYVTGAESAAGDTEYRCIYLRNSHGSLILYGAKVWIATNSPSADTHCQIALGTSAINGTEQTVANENTAPTGVSFADAANEGAALSIGDIPPGEHKALWIKRDVTAGASAYNNDGLTITFKGDSGA